MVIIIFLYYQFRSSLTVHIKLPFNHELQFYIVHTRVMITGKLFSLELAQLATSLLPRAIKPFVAIELRSP